MSGSESKNETHARLVDHDQPPVVIGQPYKPSYYQREDELEDQSNQNLLNRNIDLGETEKKILDTYSLGRGLVFLAIVDVILLTFLAFFNIYYLLLLWGPILGLFGACNYEPCYMYFYIAYYFFRLAGDICMIYVYHFWWSILGIVLDVLVITFIIIFIQYLSSLSDEDREILRNPGPLILRRGRTYYVF